MSWTSWFHRKAAEAPAPEARDAVLAQMACWDGYEREAAIHTVERKGYAEAIGPLLLRANDWVPEVRAAAHEALRSFLAAVHLQHWIAALGSVLSLARGRRGDHGVLLDEISAFLGRPECLPAVLAAAEKGSERMQRFAFELAWRSAAPETRPQLLLRTLTGSLRLPARIAASLVEGLPDKADRAMLAAAACDSRFAPVRAQGLRLLGAADPAAADARALPMCLDPSASVRAVAWWRVAETDAAAAAIAQAQAQFDAATTLTQARTALEFLLAAAPDLGLAASRRALAANHAVLRAIALSGLLARSAPAEQEALLLRGLRDPAGKVQYVAARAIARGMPAPPVEDVLAIALAHRTLPALVRGFAVLARVSAWERLACVLEAMDSDLPPGGIEACQQELTEWDRDVRRNFLGVPGPVRQRVESALRRHADKVELHLRQLIEFHLRS